jgi:hypothetical protein
MRRLSAVLIAGLLAATPVMTTVAEAQTINQYQDSQHSWNDPGFYVIGGIALVAVALGIFALTEDHHHHHHHQAPISP